MSELNANRERRRYEHTLSEEPKAINLFYLDSCGKKVDLPATIVDESPRGMAAIFVGSCNLQPNYSIFWQEEEKRCKACSLVYIKDIDKGVKRLGIELLSEASFANN